MSVLKDIINDNNLGMISIILFICATAYYVIHNLYDIVTKTDIEKNLTYRGKDRILSGIFLFVFIILISVISTFNQLVEINEKYGIFFSVILILGVSTLIYLLGLLSLAIGELVIYLLGLVPVYEVKFYEDKEDYWRIVKVTKNNSVILKKDDLYLSIPSVNELDHKLIRVHYKKKKKHKK